MSNIVKAAYFACDKGNRKVGYALLNLSLARTSLKNGYGWLSVWKAYFCM